MAEIESSSMASTPASATGAGKRSTATFPKTRKQSKESIYSGPESLIRGYLRKRSRGVTKVDLRALKFQQRYCRLTANCLEYYKVDT